uniref:Reverse transcriptase n=1 Tax=Cannabis sativa TaxID=3483 RepID=A0A803QK48_CANSA
MVEMIDSRFPGWKHYSSSVLEGRILLLWKKVFVQVIVLEETKQYAYCCVKMVGQEVAFCATFVYGLNFIEERKELWQGLAGLKFPVKPWILLGDINLVFCSDDRNGGQPVSRAEMEDSKRWLALHLADLLMNSGSRFTWTNNQDGKAHSRIDHVLKNENWLDNFPNTTAYFHWETVSDHSSYLALFNIPNEKILGPAGFGSGFIPSELNESTISLVPKNDSPSKAIDYRHIACCTTLYKYISRLLCSRISGLAARNEDFWFHPMCKSLGIVSLYFIDDLILFCKGNRQLVRVLKYALISFSKVTGLNANVSKSQVFYGGVHLDEKAAILQDIQFQESEFPLKCLGVLMRPAK